MGYTTNFQGKIEITPPMHTAHVNYINKFSETRRMKRNADLALNLPDPTREAANLPIGEQAEYFVGGLGVYGQGNDPSILDNNKPPASQPGLWCQWEVSEDGKYLQWNECEKFYDYVEWLEYLIRHFFKTWNYTLNGEIKWQGEEVGDFGVISCKENVITIANEARLVENPMSLYSTIQGEVKYTSQKDFQEIVHKLEVQGWTDKEGHFLNEENEQITPTPTIDAEQQTITIPLAVYRNLSKVEFFPKKAKGEVEGTIVGTSTDGCFCGWIIKDGEENEVELDQWAAENLQNEDHSLPPESEDFEDEDDFIENFNEFHAKYSI